MRQKLKDSSVPVVAVLLLTGLFGSAAAVRAQLIDTTPTIVGNAKAVQATAFGNTTVLADTGTLGGTSDAREASQVTGGVPSVLAGEVLHAVTIGWPDQVASEASIANLGLTVAGTTISADLVIARALAATGGAAMGNSGIDNLSVNGIPVYVTGEPNQTVWIPGGQVIVNEQKTSSTGILVNALRVVVTGVADIVIASATAGIH